MSDEGVPLDYSEVAAAMLALFRRARDLGASEREALFIAAAWIVAAAGTPKDDDGT